MRNANFRIPNEKHIYTESSTYKNQISDIAADKKFMSGKANLLTGLKHSSVHIGESNVDTRYTSEATDQYVKKELGQYRDNQDMIKNVKQSNL